MLSFLSFLIESHNSSATKQSNTVDLHLAGHFGSGKSTALKEARVKNKISVIDLDELDHELTKKYGKKPTTAEKLTSWHKKFKKLYKNTVRELKALHKPIVVVGHHWENGHKFAPVKAKEKVYIKISKKKLFLQRKERDKKNKNLTDAYLNKEYQMIQKELDNENYVGHPFEEIVNKIKALCHS